MKPVLAILLFTLLLISGYLVATYIDFSRVYFGLARAAVLGGVFVYFYKLLPIDDADDAETPPKSRRKGQKVNRYKRILRQWWLYPIPALVIIFEGSGVINNYLMEQHNATTTATIRSYRDAKGRKYFVYSYSINGRYYEHRLDNFHKLHPADTVQIRYYVNNPAISEMAVLSE